MLIEGLRLSCYLRNREHLARFCVTFSKNLQMAQSVAYNQILPRRFWIRTNY